MLRLSEQNLHITPPPALIFGVGGIQSLPEHVRALGGEQAFIVTDKGLVKAGLAAQVEAVLSAAGLAVSVFDGVEPNPTTDNIAAGSAQVRGLDLQKMVIVALGGGSAMDAAKGIALHATNPSVDVVDLDYRTELPNPALPLIAVPTTAGTGSENNTYGVITNPQAGRKFYVGNPSAQPKIALLDPKLTLGLPPFPTATTGIDTLIHAIESLASRNANPYADGINLQVIGMVGQWLPRAFADGHDLEARSQMLLASSIVALAYRSGTGMGLCHAIGHSLGGRLNVAHGLGLAIVLADVLRFNLPVSAAKYARVAFALGVGERGHSDEANAEAAIRAIEELVAGVKLNLKLREVGVTEALLDTLVTDSLEDIVLYNNPRQPSADDVRAILVKNL